MPSAITSLQIISKLVSVADKELFIGEIRDLYLPNMLQLYVQGVSMVLHPIIVTRLLEHRLMSSAPKRRSQSIASRSSMSSTAGSVGEYRAKDVTPEPPLGQRRNVTLTVNCHEPSARVSR